MNYKIIINPASGSGRGLRAWRKIEPALQRLNPGQITYRPHYSRSPEHSRSLAGSAALEGFDGVVVVGGDGTINDVAAATLEYGLPLAVVPAGTGNAFARSLGQNLVPANICRSLLAGKTKCIDIGRAGERIFVNMAGVGFDTEVLEAFKYRRVVRGIPGYLLTGLQKIPEYLAPRMVISTPAGRITVQASVLAICNGPYYGGRLHMAPQADMEDGLLDVCVMDNLTQAEYLEIWYMLYSGRHVYHPKVKMFQAREISLESDIPARYHCDGDVTGVTPCVVRVIPKALKIIV